MNQKTAKLIRSYVGIRKSEKAPVSLKNTKLRYLMIPRPRRGLMKDAIVAYLAGTGYSISDVARARVERARYGTRVAAGRSGLLALATRLFGLLSSSK